MNMGRVDPLNSTEKAETVREEYAAAKNLKLDQNGVPLVPQPSDNPEDPLNWPLSKKAYTAVLVSTLAFMGQLGASLISPAFVIMSEDLNITVQQASYAVTTYLIVAGITPMFIIPLTSTFGRRPAYIISSLIGIAGGVGSGAAPSWGLQQFCRVLHGLGSGLPLALAPATIADMFCLGHRGLWLGLYVLMVNNGPHIGPIIGGFVTLRIGWRWCFYIPAIILAGVWLIAIFTLPETLFSRAEADNFKKQSYARSKFTVSRVVKRKLKMVDFVRPFYMGQYAAVVFPAIFFGTSNLFGSVLFTVTIAFTTKELYRYNPSQTGLLLGVPLTIGCMIGEASAGWVSDLLTNLHAKRTGTHKPESRLLLAPFALLTAAGTIGYGWAVQHEEPWIRLAVCLAITGCGVQYGSTCVYTYVTDSYKPQSPECGALLNLIKSLFAFTSGYYALPYSREVGFGKAFTLFGCMNALSIIPLFVLYFAGQKVRAKQGEPKFHKDL